MSLLPAILVVDDEKNSREGLKHYLEAQDYEVLLADSGESALALFEQEKPDLVLADMRMPGLSGLDLMQKIHKLDSRALVILMTAYGSVEDAVKAMKNGAYYYLTKPLNLDEVLFLVKKALASRFLEEENRELRQALYEEKYERSEILAASEKMKDLLRTVDQIAQSNASVLIEGESGTGKELIAHRIHDLSPRKSQPFIAVHCAALTETLLASELFGHERGSFTGASEKKIGRFERAHKGTLFLDEIGEISPAMQVKLLRVLQEGEFERVGGTKSIRVDVRIVCATNKTLLEEVKAGRFREDLYYRINVIYLKLPSLRDRRDDIAPLAESFVRHFAALNNKGKLNIDSQALAVLTKYSWPGNIRELKNIIERMVVLSTTPNLSAQSIPEDIRSGSRVGIEIASSEAPAVVGGKLTEMEKAMILQALADCKGNKSQAAKRLGISRRTLYRKLQEYSIE